MGTKLQSGSVFPQFTIPKVGGGELQIGGKGQWMLLIVYRGHHCTLCKDYLNKLESLKGDFDLINCKIAAISSDPRHKVIMDYEEFKWTFDLGYDLQKFQMQQLGLYISEPRSVEETDREFPEPGLFIIRPDGRLQIVEISNSPIIRADLRNLPNSLKWVIDNDYPIRGTVD
tara:strand:- start:30 stop:545 length:516 start_codon:yes stop_codon:yes gene_type:complete